MKDKTSLVVENVTLKLGDIFVSSWGYEQTNIDFYQVIGFKGKKTMVLQKIHGKKISWNGQHLTGTVVPDIDNFDESTDKIVCRVVVRFGDVGGLVCSYTGTRAWLYDGKPRYFSCYA